MVRGLDRLRLPVQPTGQGDDAGRLRLGLGGGGEGDRSAEGSSGVDDLLGALFPELRGDGHHLVRPSLEHGRNARHAGREPVFEHGHPDPVLDQVIGPHQPVAVVAVQRVGDDDAHRPVARDADRQVLHRHRRERHRRPDLAPDQLRRRARRPARPTTPRGPAPARQASGPARIRTRRATAPEADPKRAYGHYFAVSPRPSTKKVGFSGPVEEKVRGEISRLSVFRKPWRSTGRSFANRAFLDFSRTIHATSRVVVGTTASSRKGPGPW